MREVLTKLSEAWKLAKSNKKAQSNQKALYVRMIVRENHLSLVWKTECSYICRLQKHAKLTSLLDHFIVLIELLNRTNWEWLFGQ